MQNSKFVTDFYSPNHKVNKKSKVVACMHCKRDPLLASQGLNSKIVSIILTPLFRASTKQKTLVMLMRMVN